MAPPNDISGLVRAVFRRKFIKLPVSNGHCSKLPFLTIIRRIIVKFVAISNLARATDPLIKNERDVYECLTKRELMAALDSLPLVRAYLIFARDEDAYQSVAVKRMVKKMGRKKKKLCGSNSAFVFYFYK